jgi:hypothetical protein
VADDSIPGKLDALTDRVGALEDGFISFSRKLHETTLAVDHNTAITVQIEKNTHTLAEHTGRLVEMAQVYGDAKTTAKVVSSGVTWTGTFVAKLAVIGGALAAAWHWFKGS